MTPSSHEVTATELRERTASVLRSVEAGAVAVVSRHGRPVAAILPLADRAGLRPAELRAADLADLAQRFERREFRRRWSALTHGRWSNGGGIHGRYGASRRRRRS